MAQNSDFCLISAFYSLNYFYFILFFKLNSAIYISASYITVIIWPIFDWLTVGAVMWHAFTLKLQEVCPCILLWHEDQLQRHQHRHTSAAASPLIFTYVRRDSWEMFWQGHNLMQLPVRLNKPLVLGEPTLLFSQHVTGRAVPTPCDMLGNHPLAWE